jgi:outer membrane protein assembly factor BamB
VGSEPVVLVCLDANTGAVLWQRTNDAAVLLPPEERVVYERAKAVQHRVADKQAQLAALQKASGLPIANMAKMAALSDEITAIEREHDALLSRYHSLRTKGMLPKAHRQAGYTTPTPATDGRDVFMLSGNGIITSHGTDGTQRWAQYTETPTDHEGHATSPLVAGGHLITHVETLTAMDRQTGRKVWQAQTGRSWGTPVRAVIGETEVVVTSNGTIVKAGDGKVLATGIAKLTHSAPVVHGNIVYFIQNGGKAVRLPDTLDEPFEVKTVWTTEINEKRHFASPLYYDGLLYTVQEKGILSVIDAETGKRAYEQDLGLNRWTYSSPAVAGDHIYLGTEAGCMIVIKPGRKYREVARNPVDKHKCSPLFSGSRLYVRGYEYVMCIGVR